MPTPNEAPTTYPRSLGYSSTRYGACEICGQYASNVSLGYVDVDGVPLVGALPAAVIWFESPRFGHATCLGGAR